MKKILISVVCILAGAMLIFSTVTCIYLLKENAAAKHTINQESETIVQNGSSDPVKSETGSGDSLSVSEINNMVAPSVVLITGSSSTNAGQGSGFIISSDGYIATNAHVVSAFSEIKVTLNNEEKTEYPAQVIGTDTVTDIAVIKINAKDLPAVSFGISGNLQVGDNVVVIGNPLGEEFAGSVTTGIVSALNREVQFSENEIYTYIQTDAAINSGNSGGPLVNMQGQVVGVNAAKIDNSVAEGMGFAIPIDDAVPVLNDLMQYGYVKDRSYIGIGVQTINEQASQYYGLPVGVQVTQVEENGPAQKAGILRGDVITAVNDTEVTSLGQLNKIKYQYKPGDTIELTLFRYQTQKTEKVKLTLTETPQTIQ